MVLGKFIKYGVKERSEQRFDFLIYVGMNLFQSAIIYLSYISLYSKSAVIGALTYEQFLKGIIIYNASSLVSSKAFARGLSGLARLKISGNLDKLLLKPLNSLYSIMLLRFNSWLLIEPIIILALIIAYPGENYSFLWWIIPGGIIYFHLHLLLASIPLHFTLEKDPKLTHIRNFFETMQPTVFPEKVLNYMQYFFPIFLIGFGEYFIKVDQLNFSEYILSGLILVLVSNIIFYTGIKKYESAGY